MSSATASCSTGSACTRWPKNTSHRDHRDHRESLKRGCFSLWSLCPLWQKMPFTELQNELDERAALGLLRQRRMLQSPQSPHIVVDGTSYLSFCSNDYLGLANDPQLIAAMQQGAAQHGAGAGTAHLGQLLAKPQKGRKLVITDAVFSMDGDIAPLPELLALCEQHDAWLLVDDAHGFGVLGEQGRGSLAHFGIASPRIIYMATLGKAAGVFGAFVAAEQVVIDTLINRAHSYVYTTATPPALASAVLESLTRMEQGNELDRK